MQNTETEYKYSSAHQTYDSAYLFEPVKNILASLQKKETSVFELGCGNGYHASQLASLGYEVTAVDTSKSGIQMASENYPNCTFEIGSAYDDLAQRFGVFDCVVSLEVVEHVFAPRDYAKTVYDLLTAEGTAIISTPFHGYWKNLAIALTGKFDAHVDPLWDGGHIKFWSKDTLSTLLKETGFKTVRFELVGRVPWLAKSMIAIAQK